MDTSIEVAMALRVKMHIQGNNYYVKGFRNDFTIIENDSEEKELPEDIQNELVDACAKAVGDVMIGAAGLPKLDKWVPTDEKEEDY